MSPRILVASVGLLGLSLMFTKLEWPLPSIGSAFTSGLLFYSAFDGKTDE